MSTRPPLVWEAPAEKNTYDWEWFAKNLREHPGEWLKVFDHDRASLATAIRIHGIKALDPDKGFRVKTRNNTRGEPRMCTMHLVYYPDLDLSRGK